MTRLPARRPGLWDKAKAAARDLFPGYFALVMATGALSVATWLLGYPVIAETLLAVNVAAFATLWSLTIIRLVCFPRRVLADLIEHARGPGFFTLVAGTGVFGTQIAIVGHEPGLARWFFFAAVGLWFIVMYAFFTAVTVRSEKPDLETGINGAWLIAAVATQSVAVLGGNLVPVFASPEPILFLCLCMYLLGCMLYLSIITLIFYRLTFVRLTSDALSPPYWINMGAVAISTLSGAILILQADRWPLLTELLPFLKGFTLFFWTAATWWIPLLLALMLWRHGVRRYPLSYEPQFWGMAFPLAMYTTGTLQLSRAVDLPFLAEIPRAFIYVAAAAWIITMTGLLRSVVKAWRLHDQPPAAAAARPSP